MIDKVWIIPALMASSFLVILFFGKRWGTRATAGIGIAAVSICLLLSVIVAGNWISRVNHPPTGAALAADVLQANGLTPQTGENIAGEVNAATHDSGETVAAGSHATMSESAHTDASASEHGAEHESVPPVVRAVTWFQIGGIEFEMGTLVDGLAAMMLITVCIISLLVHIYSTEYLHGDVRFTHYYAFLSLFTASMLFYVLSSNTLQMLVGWELVGVCSFGLIGHWWEEKKNTDAALKAFLTNRVGDIGLILGVIITFFAAGGTSFNVLHINEYALSQSANTTLLLVGALCLFGGVTSKSGQFPLHTWLPDAMAGPTPVSALIHAATMVVAGVYLIARLYGVFFSGLAIGSSTFHYVAFIGGFTTIIGGLLAFVQTDLKKVLAYSTISQLGYMVMALGVGAWTAGVFHLFTHAFFKACLFLGAGSVSHACHHTFDMREMGGLRKKMPITHATFLIATLALAGIFPLAGFWSKDEILAGASSGQQNAYTIMLIFGLITAFLTAAYMGRAYWLTFWGDYRGHAKPHESPKVITVPLMILAGCAILFGFTNFPGNFFGIHLPSGVTTRFEHFVEPTFAFPPLQHAEFTPWLAVVSTILAASGLFLAYQYYEKNRGPHGLTSRNKVALAGYTFLENKYYLDDLYTGVVAGSTKGPLARAANWFNQNILDGIINGIGLGARKIAAVVYVVADQLIIDGAVNGSGQGSEGAGQLLRKIQTGKVQQYASILFAGAVVLAGVLVFVV
ncbi:MAG: NADH-quinone oxidoreductase subunit L [Actinobacteria bacterium]|jgi:NADH-quinone oxidoreductase subunit L|nr:NADH-quinone oxidoreductase subunit L [Actinomycetota bacterium]MSX33931.1 NADH-quinone oxidoreductase subunit L [Actinomycetota bacterium]MSX95254.1 NADH-quinone oxidoreductase subunit L [Actinomycetota bacterium]MSY25204.1 NADH-quinone oxidoreductase subunit L [Actinomycetota bacterium]MSY33846.1 NADH-quinone oxidoreductase subunit L [Actinomycetota bacterium]